jgi:glycogen debranching enzyme
MVAITKERSGPGLSVHLSKLGSVFVGTARKLEPKHGRGFYLLCMSIFREAGLNHISEIADAESPYTPKGCPFQAWSMGEYFRLLTILGKV